ncbi:MAG: TRAP transporter large permease subunit, partial [Pseudomonadota bacterium]
ILLVAVGLINNAVTTSGLANTFALMITQWSQGSMLLALALVTIASLVLGMGLPVTAAYIVLSILSAPALAGLLADTLIVQQLVAGVTDPAVLATLSLVDSPLVGRLSEGMTEAEALSFMGALPFDISIALRPMIVDPSLMTGFLLTAHLIVFWLSQDSNVTPPVCLAAFTAAGIAGSRPMATGFEAWKVAKGLYIVPLLFAYTPLLTGGFVEIAQVAVFSLFGIYAVNALLQTYAEGPLRWFDYPLLVVGAALAFWPLNLAANIAGAIVVALVLWSTHSRQNGLDQRAQA